MQVLAGAQLDPEQLSGQKLSSTIMQLLGAYEELNPTSAEVSKQYQQLESPVISI